MLFRTRYGTKVTIKSELLAKNHIEPYVPSAVNANLLAFDEEECHTATKNRTQLDNVPDVLLDEWTSSQTYKNQFYHMTNVDLGTYIIHEQNEVIPALVKPTSQLGESQNQLWSMFFDGSRGRQGVGGGVMLISPYNEKYYAAFKFSFSCTTNTSEYEGLIQGLGGARK